MLKFGKKYQDIINIKKIFLKNNNQLIEKQKKIITTSSYDIKKILKF